jgi:exopolysaccharide biosynthesis polyprenyl glycosylphosphotransferase
MLRRDRQIRTQAHQFADACLFALSFWLSFHLRINSQISEYFHQQIPPDAYDNIGWLYFALIPSVPLILEMQGLYNRPVLGRRWRFFWALLKGCIITSVAMVLIMWAVRITTPRGVMVFFGIISFALVWIKEEVIRTVLRSKIAQNQYRRRFIMIGTADESESLRENIKLQHGQTISIVAELSLRDLSMQELVTALHTHSANGVIVNVEHAFFERVEAVIKICELEGVETWLLADFFGAQISRAEFDELGGHPLLIFRSAPAVSWQIMAKKIIDFAGACLVLLVFSWLFLLIALLVKLTSPGPVFFRQQRSGLNGSPFTLYKFRTMVTNAEQFKHELEAMNEMTGPVFKVTNDPRITGFGRFLRKYSLDEWPQFINVARGEMSLVGPRPLPVDEVKRFNDLAHRRRLSVKPGLTCIWQVTGRNKISDFKDWVRLDLEYIDGWSLWLDFKILALTIPAVLRGTGAK